MELITVWTDGACFPNPGKGGWGWTTLKGEQDSGGSDPTTNQVMELTAAIQAIRSLQRPGRRILLISDSQYVIKGATLWHHTWMANGWRNSKGGPVANKPIWEELIECLKYNNVRFYWVRGHSGDPGNEEADRLATMGSGASAELITKCKLRFHGESAR